MTTATRSIRISRDTSPTNPREDDNLGVITYRKGSRYVLGDEGVDPSEFEPPKGSVVVNVYAYVHSGTCLKAADANPFSCPWDSGQSGVIYATPEKIREAFLLKPGSPIPPHIRRKVKANLIAEVETFNAFINGDVWGYEVVETDEDGNEEVTDSCWGFYVVEPLLRGPEALLAALKASGLFEYAETNGGMSEAAILKAWSDRKG